ncbi:hypothetical protein [Actinocrispum wychmicini]|nr:hypothetical protein [Actinocrispum wychmicini]
MSDATAVSVTSRVWRTLLTLLPSSAGPIAIQHAPLTARGQLGSLREPFSSIQYPTGTRAHLIDAVGQVLEPLGAAASTFDGHPELAQLNADIVRFRDLTMIRRAEVLSCLNCMTEQRVAFQLVPALSWAEHYADPDGCCVLYEAARSLIRVKPQDQQSRRVLERISRQDVNPRLATAAAIQLGAASVRLDHDLDAAAKALDVADQRRAEVDRTDTPFVADLLDSRYYRALALLALKQRDFKLLRSSMDGTMTAAMALMARTTPADEYPLLVARENMRLVVEVHLVAATGAEKPDQFSRWAKRLLDLDPEDPFTWQYLSIYGARCGCVVEAALAASGMAIIGGLDHVGVSEALGAARVGDFRDDDLVEKILGTLESLVRPEKPARIEQPMSVA